VNIKKATKLLGNFLLTHSEDEGFDYYRTNAANDQDFDIKAWGFTEAMGKPWAKASDAERIAYVYEASYFNNNTIMTRRDQGNFFAGRAMRMTGTSEAVM